MWLSRGQEEICFALSLERFLIHDHCTCMLNLNSPKYLLTCLDPFTLTADIRTFVLEEG